MKNKDPNASKEDHENDEFQILKQEIDKATKDLKGKKFVLSQDGKPITIVNVKAENLPPYAVPVGMNITTKTVAAEGTEDHSNKTKKRVIRVAGSRDIDDSFFTAVTSLASTLQGGGNIVLNPGVSMKCGDGSVREGPAPILDSKKISRQNYFSKKSGSYSSNTMENDSVSMDGTAAVDGNGSIADSFVTNDNLAENSVRGQIWPPK